jgi:hypothetical protein
MSANNDTKDVISEKETMEKNDDFVVVVVTLTTECQKIVQVETILFFLICRL